MSTITNEPNVKPSKKKPRIYHHSFVLVSGAAWFGITKYNHSLHHEETDDAQIEANVNPVISRISDMYLMSK